MRYLTVFIPASEADAVCTRLSLFKDNVGI